MTKLFIRPITPEVVRYYFPRSAVEQFADGSIVSIFQPTRIDVLASATHIVTHLRKHVMTPIIEAEVWFDFEGKDQVKLPLDEAIEYRATTTVGGVVDNFDYGKYQVTTQYDSEYEHTEVSLHFKATNILMAHDIALLFYDAVSAEYELVDPFSSTLYSGDETITIPVWIQKVQIHTYSSKSHDSWEDAQKKGHVNTDVVWVCREIHPPHVDMLNIETDDIIVRTNSEPVLYEPEYRWIGDRHYIHHSEFGQYIEERTALAKQSQYEPWSDATPRDWLEECIKGYGDCLIWDVTRSPNTREWDITLICATEVILIRTINSAEWPMLPVTNKLIKRLPYSAQWGNEPFHTIGLVQHAAKSE